MPGTSVAAVTIAEDPESWEALGFTVVDRVARVGATELRFFGRHAGLSGWTLRAPEEGPAEVDGIPTAWVEDPPVRGERHPNGAVAVDHVVLRTPDCPRTYAALEAAGMLLRRERVAGELRQGFFRHGECIVEVVGPQEPGGGEPAALWGLTLVVDDLDATAAVLGERLGPVRDAVQPGRRIATLARGHSSVPLAFMTP